MIIKLPCTLLFSIALMASLMSAGTLMASPATVGGIANPATGGLMQQIKSSPANILFIIMDDIGIDQMKVFGYGGGTPAATPNIAAIAQNGVRFRNTWGMPECSPSRAIFFEGRYPLRTNVNSAILSNDLANSQVSPYEMTTPKVLKTVGYQSAMFGKFHLAGPDNNPFSFGTPLALGWDYFDGFLYGAPASIDTSIGGQFPTTTSPPYTSPYTCGFVPNTTALPQGGADSGACYTNSGTSCVVLSRTLKKPTPGRTCLESGGLFVANQSCTNPIPANLNFNLANGYYVWNRVINQSNGVVTKVPLSDPSVRGYVTEATNSAASAWINARNTAHQPWMASISYATIHSPYQQPPSSLLPAAEVDSSGLNCAGSTNADKLATRVLSNQMIEATDAEIGKLLVSIGLATFKVDGSLNYHPDKTNTMVVIIGDNGTYAPSVKEPFNANHAKAWVYQTGVWVPLIVAGPQVVSPNREVTAMVNAADMFQLFGEIAGVNVHTVVPSSHILDSVSVLPYLTNPNQARIRKTNFTQTGSNIHPTTPPPCVLPLSSPPTCLQLFNTQAICESEGGDWYGPGASHQYQTCCDVQAANLYSGGVQIFPNKQAATRNDNYKLVQITAPNCANAGQETTTNSFYSINENPINPLIDNDDLCAFPGCPAGLKGIALLNYKQLLASQKATLASQPACPGDGNEDMLVNAEDLALYSFYSAYSGYLPSGNTIGLSYADIDLTTTGGLSSWYDFNVDGLTDSADRAIITANLNKNCMKPLLGVPSPFPF